jgi:hypothetical protein
MYLQQNFLQSPQDVDFAKPQETATGRRARVRGVCLLSEMRVFHDELWGEPIDTCVFPVVSERDFAALRVQAGGAAPDYRRIKVVGALYCYQLGSEFGEATARAKGGIPCEIDGVWNALEEHQSLGADRVRSSFPGLAGAFVLESPTELWGPGVMLGLFAAIGILGGWIMRRSLTRKAHVGDEAARRR